MAKSKAEEQQPEKQTLVDAQGVAVSPLPDYPGEIRFPVPFTGYLYRAVTEAIAKQEGDWAGDFFQLMPYWRVVVAIADVQLEGVDAGAPFDEQPASVLRWSRDCAIEYVDRFLAYTR